MDSKDFQNFETIDTASINSREYYRVSRLIPSQNLGADPSLEHYVVALYRENRSLIPGDASVSLVESDHFISDQPGVAEVNALNFFMSKIPEYAEEALGRVPECQHVHRVPGNSQTLSELRSVFLRRERSFRV